MTTVFKSSWTVFVRPVILSLVLAFVQTIFSTLFSQSIPGGQPIKGAFEQVLGQPFDPSAATRTTIGPQGLRFWFHGPDQIPGLSEFYGLASPLGLRCRQCTY
jgi:ABC-type transport system involved in multi-copper enzyme maturation permease subunit